jgi:hypothetical protein
VIVGADLGWFRFDAAESGAPILGHSIAQIFIPSMSQVPVTPLTTQARSLPWGVALTEAYGVPCRCVVKAEWIGIVERGYLDAWIRTLREGRWPEVRRVMFDVLGFDA